MNITDNDVILQNLKNSGQNVYLVGGYIRDLYLNKISYDRDIVVKDAENFAKRIADDLNATFITLDSENQIYRLVLPDKKNFLDISEMYGNSIKEDLWRRDFTINAIAYDIKQNKYIDVTNGLLDLQNKKLKPVKDTNFTDDPLRLLRAFRFASTTGFEFTDDLKSLIIEYRNLLLKPAKERISYELLKLFGGNDSAKVLEQMDEFGVLEMLFPFIIDMKKVPKNSHHHLDLFHHTLETIRNIELLYKEASTEVLKHLNKVDFGGFPRINHLKIAGFLHDIGKYSTWTIEPSGRHRFIKHDDVGAKMCVSYLKDLKFSKKQIEYISSMIKNHIYPSSVIQAEPLTDKIIMRYIRKMDSNVIDNILLAKADRLSAKGEAITEEIITKNISGLDNLLQTYLSVKDSLEPLPKLLNGNEIMDILNISQGPMLGNIIKLLKEEQLNGNISTKKDAIEFVENSLQK